MTSSKTRTHFVSCYVLSSILYFLLQVMALPKVKVASLWNPPVWKAIWLMDKGAAMAAQTGLQLTLGLNSFSQLACHTKRYTLQLYMGMVGAQTPLPCLRTDQYFSSKGTKHLAEQLLLNSFTHWSGTPRNTQLYCRYVCACVRVCDRGNSKATRATAEVTVGGDESLEEMWGVCVVCIDSTLTWLFFLSPYFISLTITSFFFTIHANPHIHTHKHTHLVPIILLSALPGVSCVACVWGREAKRDVETDRKKEILPVLYFVVPGFDMSIPTLPFWIWSLAVLLWSFHHCTYPAFLPYCDASSALTVSAHSLSVRHFRQNLQNVRRPKPGWQTKTLPSERWHLSLEKLGLLSNAGSLGFARVRDKAANNRSTETKKQGTRTCGKGYGICAD